MKIKSNDKVVELTKEFIKTSEILIGIEDTFNDPNIEIPIQYDSKDLLNVINYDIININKLSNKDKINILKISHFLIIESITNDIILKISSDISTLNKHDLCNYFN
jgi:hypothetical protein